jgi:Tol biopolymer transport system component
MPRLRPLQAMIVVALFLTSATPTPLNTKLLASHDTSHEEKMSEGAPRVSTTSNGTVTGEIDAAMTGTTVRISVRSDGTQGNAQSNYPSISADGRYVAFVSYADNLVDGDTNGVSDIFVRDNQTNQTSRVSVISLGMQANGPSEAPSMSADGRYIAFASSADNLVGGGTNGAWDVFIHDTQTNQTFRVSVASDGAQGNGDSFLPSISADGRYLAFVSRGSNLVSGDTNDLADIFLHDTQTNQTTRVSIASDGTQANHESWTPSVSADGRYVAFQTDADNLVNSDTNAATDIFVRDIQANQTTRISVASDGTQANRASYGAAISANGRYVALVSYADNLVSGDTNGGRDTFRYDTQTNETIRVSVASDGTQANGESFDQPSISADGRYVAFTSIADNLVSGDTNGQWDLFVHDTQTNQNTRASVASDGTQGTIYTVYNPSISANGRYIAFQSDDANLVAGDTNGVYDVFIHDQGPSLDLPFPHSANQNGLSNIWSYFDHEYPIYEAEPNTARGTIVKYTGEKLIELAKCITNKSCYSGHDGYDFSYGINSSTPVLAAGSGEISASDTDTCIGNYVKINHGRFQTVYEHLQNDSFWKRTGRVNVGDRIGTAGNTGSCSTGVHIHFGVYYDQNSDSIFKYPDELVDPYGWKDRCGLSGTDPWTVTFRDVNNAQHTGATSQWLWNFSPPLCAKLQSGSPKILTTNDGVILNIPSDAVNAAAFLSYNIAPDLGATTGSTVATSISNEPITTATGHTFQVTAYYTDSTVLTEFASPITITVPYTDSDLSYGDPLSLDLYQWDETSITWLPLTTTVDIASHQATAIADKTGVFSLRAQALNPAPVLSSVFPISVSNSSSTDIVVAGTGFLPAATLNLDLSGLEVSYVSSTTLTGTIPAHLDPGTYDLILRNPDGQTALLPDATTIKSSIFLPLILHNH